jgi:hypothetical protein
MPWVQRLESLPETPSYSNWSLMRYSAGKSILKIKLEPEIPPKKKKTNKTNQSSIMSNLPIELGPEVVSGRNGKDVIGLKTSELCEVKFHPSKIIWI